MKLTNTQDFVLIQEKTILEELNTEPMRELDRLFVKRVIQHTRFLKKYIEVSMIVPCDEAGNILEEPKGFKKWFKSGICARLNHSEIIECQNYFKAKQKVLFHGVVKSEVPGVKNPVIYLNKKPILIDYDNKGYQLNVGINKIEDLIPYDVELTATAEKIILG